jgi:transglutaminase-like putative cysteine protease
VVEPDDRTAGRCAVSRSRPVDALVAAAAVAVAVWPLTTLFTHAGWARPALVLLLVVVLAGVLGRAVTGWSPGVLLLQVGAAAVAAGGLYGRGHLWHGLPTWDMVLAFNNVLVEARETIQNHAAPAPTTRGIILAVGLAVAVIAILVDYLAVTRGSPALAGLPLLTAFLISASNSGSSLHPRFFLAAAAMWLLMLGRQGLRSLRRWTSAAGEAGPAGHGGADGVAAFAALGRSLAVAGLAAALLLPMAIPHLPTRYLLDGLGRSGDATGFSDGQLSLATTVDVDRSLRNPSTTPLLTYTTTAATAVPLRVAALEDYRDGRWTPDRLRVALEESPVLRRPALAEGVETEVHRIRVSESRLEAPQLAAPSPIVAGDLGGVRWGVARDTDTARVARPAESYSVDYLDLEPPGGILAQPATDRPTSRELAAALRLDPASEEAVRRLARQVVPRGASRIEAAMAIQEHFRTAGAYTYSLQLAGPVTDARGQAVSQDPITHFLATRRGYCVQFATAMVMLARAAGVPARMAIGFLPGSFDKGVYTVQASDAHAWPELHFDGIGWLRFEPTPPTRSGPAPPYSIEAAVAGEPGAAPTAEPTSAPTGQARPDGATNDPGAAQPDQATGSGTPRLSTWWQSGQLTLLGWLLVGAVAGALGALAVPGAARARIRRRRREAADAASRAEVEWQAMVDRIGDLGVTAPPGATPRQAVAVYRREGALQGPAAQSLARAADVLERSRYGRPGIPLEDISDDAARVVSAVSQTRRRQDRLRAFCWPQEGVRAWRELSTTVGNRLRAAGDGIRARLRSR